jgi:hypothetical protein
MGGLKEYNVTYESFKKWLCKHIILRLRAENLCFVLKVEGWWRVGER